MDGQSWRELARAETRIEVSQPQLLTVRMQGDELQVFHNDRPAISFRNSHFPHGAVGLRVVDTDATFRDLQIRARP
jgi:hypothetical protein